MQRLRTILRLLKKNINSRSKKLNSDRLLLLSYLSQSLALTEAAAIKSGEEPKELKNLLVEELKKFVNTIP